MSESHVPADFAEILADERSPLIVGGQAINLWAEVYVGRCPTLDEFAPFVSRDADIFVTPQMAEELARKAGWDCRFIDSRDTVTVAVLTSRTRGDEPQLVIAVLGEVNGLNPEDLALDTVIEVAGGRRYRVPSPPVLLKAKLYNLVSLANLDRPQDIRHVKMLLRLVPLYLEDLALDHEEGRLTQAELVAAPRYAGGVIVVPYAGNAARMHNLDLAAVFSEHLQSLGGSELRNLIHDFINEAHQVRVCQVKIRDQREAEGVLGQGDRGGGGPAARAAEGNAGPALFLLSLVEPRALGLELNQTHPKGR